MTFARAVRLLAILVIVTGINAWRLSLFAQSPGAVRQYDPAFDGVPASLDQGDWGDIPAYVSAISGDARLDRDGEVTGDFEQVPLQIGDQIRTTRGRVEVLYDDGSVIALDEYSAVSVDGDNTWRLHTGRVKVVSRAGTFAVDAAPVGVARLRGNGDYRITLAVNRRSEPELELGVTRGSAELENPLGRTLVRSGTRALTTAAYAPSVPYAFAEPRDDFERWTESIAAERYGVTSAQYLPVELRSYGGYFDRDGYWSHHNTYGYVWYPRVSVGWQPFHSGRWSFVVGFGYNWIGHSRWEWPTHYYGRWDRHGSNWFWVPSRPNHFRRIGYSAPRNSVHVSVNYYSRPQPNRPSPLFRGNTNQRSRIVEAPRGDARRPSPALRTPPSSPERVAIPRSSAINRDTFPTRPSTSQDSRPSSPSDQRVFGSRQTPQNAPSSPQERVAIPRSSATNRETFPTRPSTSQPSRPSSPTDDRVMGSRPTRETPQSSRPDTFSRRPSPAAQPAPPPRQAPSPSVEAPSRPSRSEARPPSGGSGGNVGRMPDPGRTSSPPPTGSRTPSPSSRTPSGTAVRRGGGGN